MAKRAADGGSSEVADANAAKFKLPTGPGALSGPVLAESLHGSWNSGKGKCRIGKDPITARLTYEEPLEDGERLHGFLDNVAGETHLWQGTLAILEKGRGPWYGPSFGKPPEVVGKIRVRLLPAAEGEDSEKDSKPSAERQVSESAMETQICVEGEDQDWQPAVKFNRDDSDEKLLAPTGTPSLAASCTVQTGTEEEKEQGDRKRSKR